MNRRNLLLGLSGILTAAAAPAIVRAGVLMPVRRPIWTPDQLPHGISIAYRPNGDGTWSLAPEECCAVGPDGALYRVGADWKVRLREMPPHELRATFSLAAVKRKYAPSLRCRLK